MVTFGLFFWLRIFANAFTLITECLIMVALWNRADHYIFALWFLLLPFFLA